LKKKTKQKTPDEIEDAILINLNVIYEMVKNLNQLRRSLHRLDPKSRERLMIDIQKTLAYFDDCEFKYSEKDDQIRRGEKRKVSIDVFFDTNGDCFDAETKEKIKVFYDDNGCARDARTDLLIRIVRIERPDIIIPPIGRLILGLTAFGLLARARRQQQDGDEFDWPDSVDLKKEGDDADH